MYRTWRIRPADHQRIQLNIGKLPLILITRLVLCKPDLVILKFLFIIHAYKENYFFYISM